MYRTDAIYQDGVFKPLAPVGLHENQRVSLQVECVPEPDARSWLEQADRLRRRLAAEHGVFPDSTLDIAADRAR